MATMKIKTFGRSECRSVSEAARIAMEKVAAEFGLTLQVKGGKFSSSEFTPKFVFLTMAESGIPAAFTRDANVLGMKAEDFGRTFKNGGKTFKVTGINLKKFKYPIVAEDVSTGKVMLFTREGVVFQLRAQDAKVATAAA